MTAHPLIFVRTKRLTFCLLSSISIKFGPSFPEILTSFLSTPAYFILYA